MSVVNAGGDRNGIPDDQDSGLFREFVRLSLQLEINLTTDSVVQVDLTIQQVRKGWCGGI